MKLPQEKLEDIDYYKINEGVKSTMGLDTEYYDEVVVYWEPEVIVGVPKPFSYIPGIQRLFTRHPKETFRFKRTTSYEDGGLTKVYEMSREYAELLAQIKSRVH